MWERMLRAISTSALGWCGAESAEFRVRITNGSRRGFPLLSTDSVLGPLPPIPLFIFVTTPGICISNVDAVPLPSYLALGLQSRVWRTVYFFNGGGVAARDG